MRNMKNWILREPVKNHSRIDEEPNKQEGSEEFEEFVYSEQK